MLPILLNEMSRKQEQIIIRPHGDPYKVVTERLGDGSSDLKSFYFHYGANFYVFSYEDQGIRRHTFIDAGDFMYRDRILAILQDNNIKPGNIERIIITHRHGDHCGAVDILAGESGAKILVRANFKSFVEAKVSKLERRWLGFFDPSGLQGHDMAYLPVSGEYASISISGVKFPRLTEPIKIGDAGHIDIFACPESARTHTPDQLMVLYSPRSRPDTLEKANGDFRPTENIIFAGDLWLMQGPLFARGLKNVPRRLRFAYYRIKGLFSAAPRRRWNHREQDMEAKEALKRGYSLIRVKPGHGEEFLGTRIIPSGILADRDILSLLGYAMDEDRSLLKTDNLAASVSDIREKAYVSFSKELLLWIDQGYSINEISELLVCLYREQNGGGPLIAEDRRERRAMLKQTLARLRDEDAGVDVLRQIAELTLPKLSF